MTVEASAVVVSSSPVLVWPWLACQSLQQLEQLRMQRDVDGRCGVCRAGLAATSRHRCA